LYINNQGGGFADHVEAEEGTTVNKFFQQKMPNANPADYMIRVDRLPASADQVLTPGCRISMTPLKIEGA
jgi:hypothetical protein